MLRLLIVGCSLLALLLPQLSMAQNSLIQTRPKIGLALSGGGAKGAAHLGVIRQLEQHQIPVDYVAGTSMGAYFGAMLAMGYRADEIERITYGLDWKEGFIDRVGRDEQPIRQKRQRDQYQMALPFGVSSEGVSLPKGAFQGQTAASLLRAATSNLEALSSFDELAIPYRAVATDMELIQPVILDHGDLAKAMQASMSVPGALRPVEWEGKLLSDGGVVNNLPVDVLKEMGADIIIAVDIGARLKNRDDLDSAVAMVDQLSIFLTRSGTERQIALLEEGDVLIQPDMTDIGTADFDLMPEAEQRGQKAGEQAIAELAERLENVNYAAYQSIIAARRDALRLHERFLLSRIEIDNRSSLSDEVLLTRLELEPGTLISRDQLEQRLKQLYALDNFERVDYSVTTETGENVVHLEAVEKSWGPGFFDLRFALSENFNDQTEVDLGFAFTLTNLNRYGAEWRNEFEFGSKKRLYSEFYTPITSDLRYAWESGLEIRNQDRRFYDIINDVEFVEVKFEEAKIHTQVTWHRRPWQEWALGVAYLTGEAEPKGLSERIKFQIYGPYLAFDYDRLDSYSFPTRGKLFQVGARLQTEDVENHSKEYGPSYYLNWQLPFKHNYHHLNWRGEFGGSDSNFSLPITTQDLGGLMRLSGFRADQLSGRYKAFTGLQYYYQVTGYQASAFKAPIYLGGSLEKGNVWNNRDNISIESAIWAGSLYAAADTNILGPIVLAWGINEREHSIYLIIGNNF